MKKILFVDDNQFLCRLSCDILRLSGYGAEPAFSGAEALELWKHREFDILVTDLRMEGMNGLELARAIHRHDPEFPVIVVTAYDPVEDTHIRTCIAKENLFPTLLEAIRVCLPEGQEVNGEPAPAVPVA